MLSRMEDESFCCEPEHKAQPWLKVLVEQDLWDSILWILPLDVFHNLLIPSLHQQPGSCLGDVDGVGRAPCRGAKEKKDWNCFVSKLFSVYAQWRHVLRARSLNTVRSPLWSGSQRNPRRAVLDIHIHRSPLSLDLFFLWNTTTLYYDQVTLLLQPLPARQGTSSSLGFSCSLLSLTWWIACEHFGERNAV